VNGSDATQAATDVARFIRNARSGPERARRHHGSARRGTNDGPVQSSRNTRSTGPPHKAIPATTPNESWKHGCKTCFGSHASTNDAATASEFTRSDGLRSDHPNATTLAIVADRTADACQPVAAT